MAQPEMGRSTEMLLEQLLAGVNELREEQQKTTSVLSDRRGEHLVLRSRVTRIEEDVYGKDGKNGIRRTVIRHDRLLQKVIGAAAVLGAIGGWLLANTSAVRAFIGAL